jgi:hypothetical protein
MSTKPGSRTPTLYSRRWRERPDATERERVRRLGQPTDREAGLPVADGSTSSMRKDIGGIRCYLGCLVVTDITFGWVCNHFGFNLALEVLHLTLDFPAYLGSKSTQDGNDGMMSGSWVYSRNSELHSLVLRGQSMNVGSDKTVAKTWHSYTGSHPNNV